jgi:opacity protein-like surface antigen
MKRIIILCWISFLSIPLLLTAQETKQKKEKKYSIEISAGAGRINPEQLLHRASGTEELISQYANFYQLDVTTTGQFDQKKLMIPFNLSVCYTLKKKLYFKVGVEYAYNNSSSGKEFQLASQGFSEYHEYAFSSKVSYLMPQVGIGLRITNAFDLYGSLGLGLSRFTYTEDLSSEMSPGNELSTRTTYKGKGTSPALLMGIKYRIKFKKIYTFLKLEYLFLKVNRFKGSKSYELGGSIEDEVQDGTFYLFEWDPYSSGRFDYWEIFETDPTGTDKQNVMEMSLNLSCIRLMIGFSF